MISKGKAVSGVQRRVPANISLRRLSVGRVFAIPAHRHGPIGLETLRECAVRVTGDLRTQ